MATTIMLLYSFHIHIKNWNLVLTDYIDYIDYIVVANKKCLDVYFWVFIDHILSHKLTNIIYREKQ